MRNPFVHSLRFRLPLIVLLGIVPPMLAAIWYSSSHAAKIIHEDAKANMVLQAKALAMSVSG